MVGALGGLLAMLVVPILVVLVVCAASHEWF